MGKKIKPRQQRQPKGERNLIVRDMILRGGDGKFRDRRERRPKDKRNNDWNKNSSDWE